MLNRAGRYYQIAKGIVNDTVNEITNLLLRNKHPDFHFNLDVKIVEQLENAYQEGYKRGQEELREKIELFDETKDKADS